MPQFVKVGGSWHDCENNKYAYKITNSTIDWKPYGDLIHIQTGRDSYASGYAYYTATISVDCGFQPQMVFTPDTDLSIYSVSYAYNSTGFVLSLKYDTRNPSANNEPSRRISSSPSLRQITSIAFK